MNNQHIQHTKKPPTYTAYRYKKEKLIRFHIRYLVSITVIKRDQCQTITQKLLASKHAEGQLLSNEKCESFIGYFVTLKYFAQRNQLEAN